MKSVSNPDIFVAAQYGNSDRFKELFRPELLNQQNEHGSSLLHLAIAGEQFDIADFLLESGADINAENADKQTPLHLIAAKSNVRIAEKILKLGGNINARDKWNNSPMWTATFNCKGRYYEIVELFWRYRPDIHTKNKAGKSPLDFAKQVGNAKLIAMFSEARMPDPTSET